MSDIIFFLPDQKMLKFSRNGKASFSRLFFFFFPSFKQRLIYFSRKAFPFPLLEPRKGCALGTFAPASAQSHMPCPSQLGYGQILPFSRPSSALCSGHPLLPIFFGPGSPLPYPASSSTPKPRCTRGSSQQLPKRAVSCKSHPHTFPGQLRIPHCFAHHLVLLLNLPPLSR